MHRAQHLAEGFAQLGIPSYYVEGVPLYRYSARGRGYLGAITHQKVRRDRGVVVYENGALPSSNNPTLYKLATTLSLFQFRRRHIGDKLPEGAIVVFAHPLPVEFLRHMPPAAHVIYDIADDWKHLFPRSIYRKAGIASTENALIKRADQITVVSQKLAKKVRKLHPDKDIDLIRNGVSDRILDETVEISEDIKYLPRPIIGFVGTLGSFVDVKLLELVAVAYPEASLVLVGPVEIDLGELPRLSNVHLMGPQPHERVPAYLRGFDIGLNPRPMEPAGQASDPIKVFEYLGVGIPVISTRMPGQLDEFRGLVWQADTGSQFCEYVRTAMSGSSGFDPGRAKEVARANRWVNRCEQMLRFVQSGFHRHRAQTQRPTFTDSTHTFQ